MQGAPRLGSRVDYARTDARMDVTTGVIADGAGALEAWRRGIFCALGAGDFDRAGRAGRRRRAPDSASRRAAADREP